MTGLEATVATDGLVDRLAGLLGADRVLTDEWARRFHATDIYSGGAVPRLVVRPASADDLATAVRTITAAGLSVVGRGGGTSYTGGIVPDRESSAIVDTADLDSIIEVNRDDMYVTVESGDDLIIISARQPDRIRM